MRFTPACSVGLREAPYFLFCEIRGLFFYLCNLCLILLNSRRAAAIPWMVPDAQVPR
jgi:hypothetical protein